MRDLVVALLAVIVVAAAIVSGQQTALRQAGRNILVANTPVAIGSNDPGRVELQFKNEGENDVCCGYTPAALNCATPGAHSGFRYKSGEGIIRCVFPDIKLWCVDPVGGSEVSWDEAFLRTPLPTPTS